MYMPTDQKLSNKTILKLNTIKNYYHLCVSAFLLLSSAAFNDSNQDSQVLNSVLYFIKIWIYLKYKNTFR
jgi:hypothetical protein